MSDQKIFCGSGKDYRFNDGGQSLSITLNMDEINRAMQQFGFEYNGVHYLKIKAITKRNGPDQNGKTHYVEIDTYNPNQGGGNNNGNYGNTYPNQNQGNGQPQGGYNAPPQQGMNNPPPQQGGYSQGQQGGNNQQGYNQPSQQGGYAAPQQGGPQGQPRPQGYNSQGNPQGFENYQPPSQLAGQYEDDIPF